LWIIGQLPASDAISCNEIKGCFSEKIDCLRNNNSIRQKRLQINSQIIRITQKMVDIAKVTSLENYPQMIRYIYIYFIHDEFSLYKIFHETYNTTIFKFRFSIFFYAS